MNSTEPPSLPQRKGRGCLRALGIGCAVVVALLLLAALFVWLNRDAIRGSDWYRSLSEQTTAAKAEFGHMMELRASLLAEYPADDVTVLNQVMRNSSGRHRSLVVQFTNPAFQIESDGAEWETAHEIAQTVAERYPEVERFDFVRVVFASQRGGAVSVTRTTPFEFPTAELLEEAAPEGDGEAEVDEAGENDEGGEGESAPGEAANPKG